MTSSPEQTRGARLPSLTGLRFLAALLVFAFHTTWQTKFVDTPVFESAGFYGVTTAWDAAQRLRASPTAPCVR